MTKKLRVGFYMPSATMLYFPDYGREVAGGAEMNLYNLAGQMAKDQSYEVSFYVSDDGQQKDSEVEGVHVKRVRFLNHDRGRWIGIRRRLMLVFQILLMKEDVLVTTTASEHLGLLVLLHQTLKRKKVIFRLAHDHNYDLSKYRNIGKRFYRLYKYGLMHAACLVAQTVHQQEALKDLGRESVVIKNGFLIEERVEQEKKWILWVARSKPMKRPELFVELARRIPDKSFLMIIPTNKNEKSIELKEKIESRALETSNLTIIDYVSPDQIQDYFDKAFLFVNTSTFEGFPNTFIQAGIGHTPVLSFEINPDGMFAKEDIGCLCNDSMEMAVDYITSLSGEKLKQQGDRMYEYVKQHNSIEVACKAYKALMEDGL